ncbi:MAG: type I methionyl aminopeptidase, partial [Synechococcales bacterium]|nr:type I methionyl aminopeptidase [Synechococcales bacterium]
MEQIILLSKREIAKMRVAGQLAAQLLDHLGSFVQAGVSTLELNNEAERWTKAHGAISAPKGYPAGSDNPFPRSICTSVNEVVCHGIPNKKQILKDGDILNIDVTLIVDGYHGDTSKMFFVGEPSPVAKRLVEVTEKCRLLGIEQVKPGNRIGDIGAAIQEYAESQGFSVVRDFVGHGINRIFHTAPQIPHYGKWGTGKKLRPGMTFTIEP